MIDKNKQKKKVMRKNWQLGFFGFFAFFALPGLARGEWIFASWLVWILWFLLFIPIDPETEKAKK